MIAEGSLPPPALRRREQYLLIQALRFVAAIMVVCVHATYYTHERLDPSMPIYGLGAHGVRLFFVISGFVMIISSERLVGIANGWQIFAVKRMLRIVPLYWVITCLKVAILFAVPNVALHSQLDAGLIAKSYFFWPARGFDGQLTPLVGVGWTLNFEMFFYGLFATALLLRLRPIVFLAPILLGLSALSLLRGPSWPVPLYFWSDPIALDFLAGMLVARWAQRGSTWPPVLASAMVAGGCGWLFAPFPHGLTGLPYSIATTMAASVVVIGALSLEPHIGSRVPRWTLFMGAASYSLYLVHSMVAPAAPHLLGRIGLALPWLAVAVSVAISLLCGALCYRFLEMPLMRIFDSLAYRWGWLDVRARPSTSFDGHPPSVKIKPRVTP